MTDLTKALGGTFTPPEEKRVDPPAVQLIDEIRRHGMDDEIANRLAEGGRVELRGFGAFSTRERDARMGRNPRTGELVDVPAKRVPFFKAGKEMRRRLNQG